MSHLSRIETHDLIGWHPAITTNAQKCQQAAVLHLSGSWESPAANVEIFGGLWLAQCFEKICEQTPDGQAIVR